MLHRFLASLATLALLAACAPSHARPLVDVSVVDRDTGEWLSQHPHQGDVWVAGSPGHRYSVRLTNTTGERVLVVLSVDGVNAITLKPRSRNTVSVPCHSSGRTNGSRRTAPIDVRIALR